MFRMESVEARRLFAGVSLDPSFGGGRPVIDTATAADLRSDSAAATLIQSDGKVIVAGTSGDLNDGAGMVVRFNSDGSRDTSFGTAGSAFLRYGFGTTISAARLQGDGKIVLAGWNFTQVNSSVSATGYVTRLNADGSLDTGFASGGSIDLSGVVGDLQGLLVLPDGRLLVSGVTNYNGWDSHSVIARVNADGTLDTSFGTGGRVVVDQKTYTQSISSLVQLSATRVLAITSNGVVTIDPTTGVIGVPVPPAGVYLNQLIGQPDGKVIAIGNYTDLATYSTSPVMVRLKSDGTVDTTFASGMLKLFTGATARYKIATTFAREGDGSYVVALHDISQGSDSPVLLHISSAGVIDSTFAEVGSFTDQLRDPAIPYYVYGSTATTGAIDAQGRLIVSLDSRFGPRPDGGNTTDNIVLSRYVLDMGITPHFTLPTAAIQQGGTFAASASGTTGTGQSIVKYEWDSDYVPGGVFRPDATGISVTLPALRAPSTTVGLRVTTADGAAAIFSRSIAVADVAPSIKTIASTGGTVTASINFNSAFSVTDPGTENFQINAGSR